MNSVIHGEYGVNSRSYEEFSQSPQQRLVKMSPSFHFVRLGGAGVVSKEIDPKPFYESLTRIMTNAYRFAKAGKNITGTGPATGSRYSRLI